MACRVGYRWGCVFCTLGDGAGLVIGTLGNVGAGVMGGVVFDVASFV